jgi:hypothetical protein
VAVIGSNSLALGPVVGDVAGELGASVVEVARASAAYGAATAASALLLGRVVDRVGPGRVLVRALGVLLWRWSPAPRRRAGSGSRSHRPAAVRRRGALPATYALAIRIAPPGAGQRCWARADGGPSPGRGRAALGGGGDGGLWRASYVLLALRCCSPHAVCSPRRPARARAGERGAPMAECCGRGRRRALGICLLFMHGLLGSNAYLGTMPAGC